MTGTTSAQHGFNNIMSDDRHAPGRSLSLEVGLWGLLGRGLLFSIGVILLVPAPWVATMFFRYIVEHVRVPDRPNMVPLSHRTCQKRDMLAAGDLDVRRRPYRHNKRHQNRFH